MMPFKYEGDLYRPPSEAKSLILQATIGCSHNRCTFCSMYKRKQFRLKAVEEIKGEIKAAAAYYPRTKRVFLADGNALVIPTEALLEILETLDSAFPALERVSLYGNTQDLIEKNVGDLIELKNNKLGIIYLGLESGSSSVLKEIQKGVTPDQMIEGSNKAKAAGIPLSVTILNGIAGVEGSEEHAEATAGMLNRIDPEYLGLLSLITVPGTPIHRSFEDGLLTELNPWQLLEEIRIMILNLSLSDCIFRANHASNYLPLKAVLSRDKQAVLSALDTVLEGKAPHSIKSEFMRGI